MEFELIEEHNFHQMAIDTGFNIDFVYGDYEENAFNPEASPVMIWELRN